MQDVRGISVTDKALIGAFMQGAIYSWIKDAKKGDRFAVRDLVGGANKYWDGTPLHVLFLKHKALKKSDAAANKQAGIELGWLVKTLLEADKRRFRQIRGFVNTYEWVD